MKKTIVPINLALIFIIIGKSFLFYFDVTSFGEEKYILLFTFISKIGFYFLLMLLLYLMFKLEFIKELETALFSGSRFSKISTYFLISLTVALTFFRDLMNLLRS